MASTQTKIETFSIWASVDIHRMTNREKQVFLRQHTLLLPQKLRSSTKHGGVGERSTRETADMTGNAHSQMSVLAAQFVASGMGRSATRRWRWQDREGRQPKACGWFSCHRSARRLTTLQRPTRASSRSCACLRVKPRGSSSMLNGSAHPANASENREAVS